jgi:hypothetical protein
MKGYCSQYTIVLISAERKKEKKGGRKQIREEGKEWKTNINVKGG